MTPRMKSWLALIAGITAGFGLLFGLLDDGAPAARLDLVALGLCLSGAALAIGARGRRCKDQTSRR